MRFSAAAIDLEEAIFDGDERRIRRCQRVFNKERRCQSFSGLLKKLDWTLEEARNVYKREPIADPLATWEEWKKKNNAPAHVYAFLCQKLITQYDAAHPPVLKTRMTMIRRVPESVGDRLRLVMKPTPEA